ncbi:Dolichol phosphate-mannose biosynthesis regulatory [Kalmanozyma brasiliensis GHG001]|uniref:Dolichol phosphate-mannose biosynthesis regulatory n=1 Tax=Kalmanozyma brasiliensis (strain GHG001) TaxID=1365824 RepID=UPI002867C1A9|nr:Dolichol phosphate-mannose biosynthesis regulatory [Kalmanozyma brasiliensis GHG001]KAF6767150.1 Dolichol phosphate-mannose biosynthesis regulatory [Kalmanozyma brasiliensis GHG001]
MPRVDKYSQVHVQGTSNRLFGALILLVSLALFGSYTLWALVLPFLPSDSPIHTYVPDRRWAITLPSLVLLAGLGTVGIYAAMLLRQDAQAMLRRQEARAR